MQRSVSVGVSCIHFSEVATFIARKHEDDSFVAFGGCDVQDRLLVVIVGALVVDAVAKADLFQEIFEHVRVIVIDGVVEAVVLFCFAPDPLLDKVGNVLVRQSHAVLKQDLQALELVAVTGEQERAEVSVHAHARHLLFFC